MWRGIAVVLSKGKCCVCPPERGQHDLLPLGEATYELCADCARFLSCVGGSGGMCGDGA